MGQYHQLWAFDAAKQAPPETIDHYALGAGAKLAEQAYAWSGPKDEPFPARQTCPYAATVGLLSMQRWRGRRLVVIGDYAEPDDVVGWDENKPVNEWWGEGGENDIDATPDAINLIGEAAGYSFTGTRGWQELCFPDDLRERLQRWIDMPGVPHVLASSCGEYLRPEALGSPVVPMAMPFVGALWPSVLGMLACSDGRGGGDFCFEPAGRWAYTVVTPVPADSVDQLTDVTDWLLSQERAQHWIMSEL